jgi:hypothetical protein
VAQQALSRCAAEARGLEPLLIRVADYLKIVDSMPPDALLVLGAPGGSWVKRRFSGRGKRMVTAARTGALIVRAEPVRAFQRAAPSTTFGPQMLVADALRLIRSPAVPVARDGALVGIVRSARLTAADPGATLESVMEAPISVNWDAATPVVARASSELGGAPVPIVGPKGQLIGSVTG